MNYIKSKKDIIYCAMQKSGDYITSVQQENGALPWFTQGKLDPWDHTEAAMGLTVLGHYQAAKKAFNWLKQNQLDTGSWYANYFVDNVNEAAKIDTNFVAYCATGLWHYYLCTKDKNTLIAFYPMIEKAINFVIAQQYPQGDIQWALSDNETLNNDALITACSSIYKSIQCAINIDNILAKNNPLWEQSLIKLGDALMHKPARFDRTWESKERFSMDWFYPILAGLYNPQKAAQRLKKKWSTFIEPTIGCRCVSDEPWVTVAETCEFIIALNASGNKESAEIFLHQLLKWQDHDGGFWTGYNFKNDDIWPVEKTTWTAGAFILAADAIYGFSGGSEIFSINL